MLYAGIFLSTYINSRNCLITTIISSTLQIGKLITNLVICLKFHVDLLISFCISRKEHNHRGVTGSLVCYKVSQ